MVVLASPFLLDAGLPLKPLREILSNWPIHVTDPQDFLQYDTTTSITLPRLQYENDNDNNRKTGCEAEPPPPNQHENPGQKGEGATDGEGNDSTALDTTTSLSQAQYFIQTKQPFVWTGQPELLELEQRWNSEYLDTHLATPPAPVIVKQGWSSQYRAYHHMIALNAIEQGLLPQGWTPTYSTVVLDYSAGLLQRIAGCGGVGGKEGEQGREDQEQSKQSCRYPSLLVGGTQLAKDLAWMVEPKFAASTPPSADIGPECRFARAPLASVAHTDMLPNFAAQVSGYKRFILLPPSEHSKVFPFERHHPYNRHSQADWNQSMSQGEVGSLDTEFPGLLDALAYDVLLRPGDILHIPSGWGHFVASLGTLSIMCNYYSHTLPVFTPPLDRERGENPWQSSVRHSHRIAEGQSWWT